MTETEKACLTDPRVQEEIRLMDLPEDAVVCIESWTYGTDGMNDMSKKITMVRRSSALPLPRDFRIFSENSLILVSYIAAN